MPTYVFLISIAIKYLEKHFEAIKFGSDNNFLLCAFVVTNLMSLWLLTFSIVLPNTELFTNLKKSFSNSFFAFFS